MITVDVIRPFESHVESRGIFHPRPTLCPDGGLTMTQQRISGSDYFGPVCFCRSLDGGRSWIEPQVVPGMGRKLMAGGIEDGVCDVVPHYHPPTRTVLAIGHNVYYRDGRLYDSLGDWRQEAGKNTDAPLRRYPVYTVQDEYGHWSEDRKVLRLARFQECAIYTCGCAQKVIEPDGDILIPISFSMAGRKDRMVTSVLCRYDGRDLVVRRYGTAIGNPVGRGLLEPSLIAAGQRYYLTLRAEDERGYVAVSDDGLSWDTIKPWSWDDGAPLTMGSTQQHWLELGGRVYLVYTRRSGQNEGVIRWRAPLFIAECDLDRLCLVKDTERTVFPISGDPADPATVGLMGNFHTLALSDREAIVTVGEMRPHLAYAGDLLLARVRWNSTTERSVIS